MTIGIGKYISYNQIQFTKIQISHAIYIQILIFSIIAFSQLVIGYVFNLQTYCNQIILRYLLNAVNDFFMALLKSFGNFGLNGSFQFIRTSVQLFTLNYTYRLNDNIFQMHFLHISDIAGNGFTLAIMGIIFFKEFRSQFIFTSPSYFIPFNLDTIKRQSEIFVPLLLSKLWVLFAFFTIQSDTKNIDVDLKILEQSKIQNVGIFIFINICTLNANVVFKTLLVFQQYYKKANYSKLIKSAFISGLLFQIVNICIVYFFNTEIFTLCQMKKSVLLAVSTNSFFFSQFLILELIKFGRFFPSIFSQLVLLISYIVTFSLSRINKEAINLANKLSEILFFWLSIQILLFLITNLIDFRSRQLQIIHLKFLRKYKNSE
ncbi:Transmembrane domain-containing protein [Spironucleus salmonicida]|uniref:Transmembrane domain-containing protein n=1 Tax=Spironucleus salmonicida TaxID=348837 RepID=A0A9P8LY78_9EUKA|nr:Transmembrane domain-containing protein [Spironucleus salmonicida]